MNKLIAALIAATLGAMLVPAAPAHAAKAKEYDRTFVITAGDSITDGAGAMKRWSYPAQLGRMYSHDVKVKNVGHGSSCLVFESCAWGDTLLETFKSEVLDLRPDVAIVAIGRNDLCHTSTADYKVAMRSLRSAGERVGVQVIYGTITPPNKKWAWPCEEQAAEINAWLLRHPTTIDFAAAVKGSDGTLRHAYDYGDGLHMNGYGYRAMAKAAGVKLAEITQ